MEIRERLDNGTIKIYAITNNEGLPLFYYEETITEVEDISTKN